VYYRTACLITDSSAGAIIPAWSTPFVGESHELLYNILHSMHDRRDKDGADHHYLNQVSLIQSSGSGKSRLIEKVAERVFTIPFCLRPDAETEGTSHLNGA
jgi:hypothetical protein